MVLISTVSVRVTAGEHIAEFRRAQNARPEPVPPRCSPAILFPPMRLRFLIFLIVSTVFALILAKHDVTHAGNETSRYSVVESVLERGTFAIDDSIFKTPDKGQRNGHYYGDNPDTPERIKEMRSLAKDILSGNVQGVPNTGGSFGLDIRVSRNGFRINYSSRLLK